MNNKFSPIRKYMPLFICWFLGIYIVLFVMCFYAHVNESNIIANRADALITQITHTKSSLVKVSFIQNMTRKKKPSFLEPSTVIWSLIGKREPYKLINKLLGNAIENGKPDLADIGLGQVDLEAADLSNADMHGVNLVKADLSGANLSGSNLITAKLSNANLRGANLFNTNLYKADFSNTILNGANLQHSLGITCAQIKSAVINENTSFPSYISLEGSTESVFKCVNSYNVMGMDLSRINLVNSYPRSADFSGSDFSNADMHGVNLVKADLSGANLSGSNLITANLSNANLLGANLFNTNLYKVDFSNTILNGANLQHSLGITCAQIKSAVINENTSFPSYISLEGSTESVFKCVNSYNVMGMDLSRINLVNSYPRSADFGELNLGHANFMNAMLAHSHFYNANLSKANLSKANLKGAILIGADLEGADLTGADLAGANLNRAENINCEQIKSAVIDENTRLPDYISLSESSDSAYKCKNTLNKN
jgi:uncharacterized protein YjbI with pentapeptide repeats